MKTLNEWMDSHGISPEQAAEIFGKSVGTIRNWRSAGVPKNQIEWVEKRMVEWSGVPLPELPDRITIEVSAEQFDAWNHAALLEGKLLRSWAIDALDQYAAEDEQTGSDLAPDPLQSVPAPSTRATIEALQRGAADLKAARLKKLSEQGPEPGRAQRVADEETPYETNGNTKPKN